MEMPIGMHVIKGKCSFPNNCLYHPCDESYNQASESESDTIDELPSHPSFQRDYISNENGISGLLEIDEQPIGYGSDAKRRKNLPDTSGDEGHEKEKGHKRKRGHKKRKGGNTVTPSTSDSVACLPATSQRLLFDASTQTQEHMFVLALERQTKKFTLMVSAPSMASGYLAPNFTPATLDYARPISSLRVATPSLPVAQTLAIASTQTQEHVFDMTSELQTEKFSHMETFVPDIVELAVICKELLPPKGEFKRNSLDVGTLVWAMPTNLSIKFIEGTVMRVLGKKLYKVQLGINDIHLENHKLYNLKELAFHQVSTVEIPVGTRVIARNDHFISSGMFLGVVGEAPITTNGDRYLIFFDDGDVKYLEHTDIRVVCFQSQDVSEDIAPKMKCFVKQYLSEYPERTMLKLQANDIISAECNSIWSNAIVIQVDASLVQVKFSSGRIETFYRGSERLELLEDDEDQSLLQPPYSGIYHRHFGS